jgi:hypothetical protein
MEENLKICFPGMEEETGGINTQTRILIIGSVTLGCLLVIGMSVIFCYLRRKKIK